MREIVLDTETTGFDPDSGDRIVEIGALELRHHVPTGKSFHEYINPERDMPQGAFEVHGLSQEFLSDKPLFTEIADGFLEFAGDAPLVIHNASFDMKFLNAELRLSNREPLALGRAIDTLLIARRKYPGAPASLDALCKRFGVDASGRTLHGALLDAQLLAGVYLELIGGREPGLTLAEEDDGPGALEGGAARRAPRPKPLAPRLSEDERAAHTAFVAGLGKAALWDK
ncbi:DNA polymerase III subunit epsilon [bacterium AH-315-P15]|nr:DNA polymerase III subunit epsilon [bacterium AH-315-P15]